MDKHKALVEVTAKAIYEARAKGEYGFMDWDELSNTAKKKWYRSGRAAINAVYEALKEPSNEMLNVPLGQTTGPDVTFNGELLSRDRFESRRDLRPTIWQAMLSASALQEGE